jgi:hypothetical protein
MLTQIVASYLMRQMEWWTNRIFQALTVGLRELQMICWFWETKSNNKFMSISNSRLGMSIAVTIYRLVINEDIMSELTDHDECQRLLNGDYVAIGTGAQQGMSWTMRNRV